MSCDTFDMFTLHTFHVQLLSDDVTFSKAAEDAVFPTELHPSKSSSSAPRDLTSPHACGHIVYLIRREEIDRFLKHPEISPLCHVWGLIAPETKSKLGVMIRS